MVRQSNNGCLTVERWRIWYEADVSTTPPHPPHPHPPVLEASRRKKKQGVGDDLSLDLQNPCQSICNPSSPYLEMGGRDQRIHVS